MATFMRNLYPSRLFHLSGFKRPGNGSEGVSRRMFTHSESSRTSGLSLMSDKSNIGNPTSLLRLQGHNPRPAGQRFASGQTAQVKKGLSRTSRAVLAVSGVLSAGYLAVRLTVNTQEPAKPYQISLYRRMPLKSISRMWGRFNQVDLPVFLRRPLIGLYVWLFGCDLQEALESDLRSYRNLGEFFRRQLRHGVRPVDETHVLTSPSDGKVLYHGQVKNGILEQVKGVTYSLRGFLGPQTWDTPSPVLTSEGQDLIHQSDEAYQSSLRLRPGNELHHCIIYLAPGDYHRFHSPTTWTVEHRRHFPGELLSVNPGVARWIQGLFNFNERAVYTGQWEHGFFSMSAVGATNVGSIKIYCDQELETNIHGKQHLNTFFDKRFPQPVTVHKGDMFGEFNLGSTIVLIFEAPRGFQFKVNEGDKIKFGSALGSSV